MRRPLNVASCVCCSFERGRAVVDRYLSQVPGRIAQVAATRPHVFAAVALVWWSIGPLRFLPNACMAEYDLLWLVLPFIDRLDLFGIFWKTTLWWTSCPRHLIVAAPFCAQAVLCLFKTCLFKSIHMLIVTFFSPCLLPRQRFSWIYGFSWTMTGRDENPGGNNSYIVYTVIHFKITIIYQ